MVAQEVYNEEIARLSQGKKIKPVAQALIDNQRRIYEQKTAAMGQSFSVYTVIMGSLNGVFEDLFVNVKDRLAPNAYTVAQCKVAHPKRGSQDKKAYKKMINKWLRQGTTDKDGNYTIQPFPYFTQELSQAVKNFDPIAFEKWARKHLNGDMSLVENTVDGAIETLQKDVTILRYSIKNEMDAMRLPDTGLRSEVYALYALGQIIETFHLGLMLIGPIDNWNELLDNCDFLKKVDTITMRGSSTYDQHYYSQMNEALCYWNIRYAEQMYKAVCGQWTHVINGMTDRALEAIKRRVTSTKFLEDISNSGISNDPEHAREVAQINSLWVYKTGKVSFTILHLDALKRMNQGQTLEEIDDWLTNDKMVHTTQPVRKQILLTCALVKAVENGELDLDYYNDFYARKYDAQYAKDMKAKREGRDPQDEVVPEATEESTIVDNVHNIVGSLCRGITERKADEAEHQQRQEAHRKLQEERRQHYEEVNADPLLRLSQKFNVTALKEKKPTPSLPRKKSPTPSLPRREGEKPAPSVSCDQSQDKPKEPKAEPTPVSCDQSQDITPMMTPTPATPKINRRRWSPAEEAYLERHHNDPMESLVKHYWRTEASIRCKIQRMTKDGKFKKKAEPQIPFE